MNSQQRQELVAYKLKRAQETLVEVESHIQNELWITAVNRLYYACFYAVTALLIDHEIETQTHAGTKQMFGLHFIKPGLIKPDSGKFYSTIFSLRQTGDYDAFVEFERDYVVALVEPATDLIAQIEAALTK